MPELPEVETIRRQLEPMIVRRQVEEAGSHPSSKFTAAIQAIGTKFEGLLRKGKYLIAPLSDGQELIVHLGMTGSLGFLHTPAAVDEDRYIRAWWLLDNGVTLAYRDVRRFGRIRCVPAGCYDDIPTLASQGPDALSDQFTAESLYTALRKSSRRIPTQLLSQRPVGGVGNIYANEALWRAGIHPARRQISKAAAHKLHRAIVEVLQEGLENGGTTLRDYRNANGGTGNNQHNLDCYGRSGKPCLKCNTTLKHRTYDARTLTFCPTCQPR